MTGSHNLPALTDDELRLLLGRAWGEREEHANTARRLRSRSHEARAPEFTAFILHLAADEERLRDRAKALIDAVTAERARRVKDQRLRPRKKGSHVQHFMAVVKREAGQAQFNAWMHEAETMASIPTSKTKVA